MNASITTSPTPAAASVAGAPAADTPWRRVAAVSIGLAALVTTLLIAFALPNARAAAHELPVAVVAPADVAAKLQAGLDATSPGVIDLVPAASADAARDLILDREAYGAFVIGKDGHTLLVASAASTTVSTMLTQVAQGMAAAQGLPITVEDVAPFPADDPRGAGLAAGALPLAVGGLVAGVALTLTVRGARQRLAAGTAFAVVGGFALMAVLQYWVGTLDGPYLATSLVATLGLFATTMLVLGLARALGSRGFAVGALLIFVLGNPLSGLSNAPDLLPRPWGTLGQLLPPGATGALLRNVVFFDGAATMRPMLVLAVWAVIGLALFALGGRAAGRKNEPDGELPQAATQAAARAAASASGA